MIDSDTWRRETRNRNNAINQTLHTSRSLTIDRNILPSAPPLFIRPETSVFPDCAAVFAASSITHGVGYFLVSSLSPRWSPCKIPTSGSSGPFPVAELVITALRMAVRVGRRGFLASGPDKSPAGNSLWWSTLTRWRFRYGR